MSVEIMMLIGFISILILTGWKFYHFMPMKPLPDDDSDEASKEELTQLMLTVIKEQHTPENPLDAQALFEYIVKHESFDKNHYWRFNHNKLNQLLSRYYARYPHTGTLPAIYEQITKNEEIT